MSLKFRYTPAEEKVYTEAEHFEVVKRGDYGWSSYVGFGVLAGEVIVGVTEIGSNCIEWRRTEFTYDDLKSAMEEYERLHKEHK